MGETSSPSAAVNADANVKSEPNAAPSSSSFVDALGAAVGPKSINETDSVAPAQPGTPDTLSEAAALRNKLAIAAKALKTIERNITNIVRLLEEPEATAKIDMAPVTQSSDIELPFPKEDDFTKRSTDGRVIEGVFDGQHMVGSDGKSYIVPANYASKSKLVEGDMLKLTITNKGSFIYKQIGPIERQRLMGSVGFDPTTGEYYATSDNKRWNVLKASITYFKGESGDDVVLLVPKNNPSKWAAVENVIKKDPLAA